jgi:RHS repeat-associated protein
MVSRREQMDANGVFTNLQFLWDGDNRLRKVNDLLASGATVFTADYDGDGTRIKKQDMRGGAAQSHEYSYSPFGLLWENNLSTIPTSTTTTYTPGFGQRVQSGGSSTDSFFQVDWLGSTRYVTDSTGQQTLAAQNYDAWGNRIAQALGSPNHPTDLQWAGAWGYQREYSNGPTEPGLGLYYVQQRYYEPSTGRWFAQDPLGLAAGTNLYGYAGSDPVSRVDPTGTINRGLEYEGGIGGGGETGDVSGVEGRQLIGKRISQLIERLIEEMEGPSAAEAEAEAEAEGVAARRAPNPNGRPGCPEHRGVIRTTQEYLEDTGWKRVSGGTGPERGVRLPWNGRLRFPDLVMRDAAGRTIAINVGRVTAAAIPVARELRAIADLINASVFDEVTFVPYFP